MRWFVVILGLIFLISMVTAHDLEDHSDIPLLSPLSSCLAHTSQADRIACYTEICSPSVACVRSLLITATAEHGPEGGIEVLLDIAGFIWHVLFTLSV